MNNLVNVYVQTLKPIKNVEHVLLKMMFKRLKGKLFTASFVKASGEERTLSGRTGVKKGVKGVRKSVEKDPIVEFAKNLRKSSDKEDWQLAKKIEPKKKSYI